MWQDRQLFFLVTHNLVNSRSIFSTKSCLKKGVEIQKVKIRGSDVGGSNVDYPAYPMRGETEETIDDDSSLQICDFPVTGR